MPSILSPRLAALSLPLALMACVDLAVPPAGPFPIENACGAAELQYLVRQPAARLETMRFSGPVRIIRPGMAVTMDYLANRLNIQINIAEKIVSVSCG